MLKKNLFLSFLFLVFLGCAFSGKNRDPAPSPQKTLDTMTFETSVQDFHGEYKKALFTTGQAKGEEAKASTENSLKLWEKIKAEYTDSQPKEYLSTHDWKERLSFIEKLMKDADAFSKNEQFPEAHESLEGVRKALFQIRKENGRENLSDTMLVFHDTMEELIAKGGKDSVLLAKLQEEVIPIVEKQGVPAYQDASQNLGKMVEGLSEKEGQEYSDELQKIKQVFINLYLLFG